MIVKLDNKPTQVTLTIQNERDRRLLYGFLMLDVNINYNEDDTQESVDAFSPEDSPHDCIVELAKVISDDSTFDSDEELSNAN